MSWKTILLYFFSWNFITFWQKDPIKVQHLRHCALIGSFCWKYIKFQLFHDTEEWCKIWRKTDLLSQKWQEFDKFWPEHSKVTKIPTKTDLRFEKMTGVIWQIFSRAPETLENWDFDGTLLPKIKNARAKNLQRSYV